MQLHSSFFEHLKFLTGISYDSYSAFENKVTYRGGLSYDFPTGTTLRAGAGTGYRVPTIGQQAYYNNPRPLKPETSTLYEVGVDQELLERRLKIGVTGFHDEIKNAIAYTEGATVCTVATGSDFKCYINNDMVKSKGIETTVDANVSRGPLTDSI